MKSYGREGEDSGIEIQKTGEGSEFQDQKGPLLKGFVGYILSITLGR